MEQKDVVIASYHKPRGLSNCFIRGKTGCKIGQDYINLVLSLTNDNSCILSKRNTRLKEDSERLYYLHDELGSIIKIIEEGGKISA